MLLINAIVALSVGWFVYPAAMATGNTEALCKQMQGKYDATAKDQCAGGDWARLIPLFRPK